MISKKINILKSNNSIPTWSIAFPALASTAFLDFDSPQSVVVPSGVNIAIITYSSGPNVIVNQGAFSELIPTLGGAFVSTNARVNPPSVSVIPGETLFFRSANSSGDIVSIAFYTNDENRS
jgi:hypothetical protein